MVCPDDYTHCFKPEYLCHGQAQCSYATEATNYCTGPKETHPYYNKSKDDCFHGTFCPQNPRSPYHNTQCSTASVRHQFAVAGLAYICLNRMDLPETAVETMKISSKVSYTRYNLFSFFINHNKTHVSCGTKTVQKKCISIFEIFVASTSMPELSKFSCINEDNQELQISPQDLCMDFAFMEAMK